jgi:hypothetical protein
MFFLNKSVFRIILFFSVCFGSQAIALKFDIKTAGQPFFSITEDTRDSFGVVPEGKTYLCPIEIAESDMDAWVPILNPGSSNVFEMTDDFAIFLPFDITPSESIEENIRLMKSSKNCATLLSGLQNILNEFFGNYTRLVFVDGFCDAIQFNFAHDVGSALCCSPELYDILYSEKAPEPTALQSLRRYSCRVELTTSPDPSAVGMPKESGCSPAERED